MNITINNEDYPMLSNFKTQELDKITKLIFKTGYEIIFPSKPSNDPLVGKIISLENTLERLIGIGNGSSKKGEMAEYILASIIKTRYGDIDYFDTSQKTHSGDAHIKFDGNDTKIMLESKNYTTKVNKDEIEKMKYDMVNCNIKWGIFISWNSNIIDKKEFDIELFHDKGITFQIIYISNLSNDIDRLDLAIQLVRKLIIFNNDMTISWVQTAIESELEQLNTIISDKTELNNNILLNETKLKDNNIIINIYKNRCYELYENLIKIEQYEEYKLWDDKYNDVKAYNE